MPGEKKVVRDQYYMLRVLSDKKTSPNLYKAIIKQSNKQLINALTQCSKNLLHNNKLILDQKVRQQFENNRDFFYLSGSPETIDRSQTSSFVNQSETHYSNPSFYFNLFPIHTTKWLDRYYSGRLILIKPASSKFPPAFPTLPTIFYLCFPKVKEQKLKKCSITYIMIPLFVFIHIPWK